MEDIYKEIEQDILIESILNRDMADEIAPYSDMQLLRNPTIDFHSLLLGSYNNYFACNTPLRSRYIICVGGDAPESQSTSVATGRSVGRLAGRPAGRRVATRRDAPLIGGIRNARCSILSWSATIDEIVRANRLETVFYYTCDESC